MITLIKHDQENSLLERELLIEDIQKSSSKGVFIQTCNRVELYTGSGIIPPHISRHLFSVVSGIKSTFIGENAIQGQVKQAYLDALERKSVNTGLNRLFQRALYVGKRVRSTTGIGRGAVSHSLAIIDFLKARNINLSKKRVTIIGVHNMNRTIIRYLQKNGASTIFLANRNLQNARDMAAELGCFALSLESLEQVLPQTDILVSASAAPHYILRPGDFTLPAKALFIDLAVPRDIDPAFGLIPGIELYNIEDFERILSNGLQRRESEKRDALRIIDEEVLRLNKEEVLRYAN